jgi:DegV family protein with EDD domain
MTRTVAIVTDSTSDLTKATRDRAGITVVPLNVHFGQETFRDGVDLDPDAFMRMMATADRLPTTSQPAAGAFEATFRELAADHDEICCVLISGKLSGTVQSAALAAEAVAGVVHVEIVDSGNVTYGLGFQALRAAGLASQGLGAADIGATLATETGSYHVVFFVETLEHLRRGGRIGKSAQLLGAAIKLRPLLRVDEGQIVPFERTRTRSRAITALHAFARDVANVERAAVIYNTTPEDAIELARQLEVIVGSGVDAIQVGPVVSTHVGPGMLGVVLKEGPGE